MSPLAAWQWRDRLSSMDAWNIFRSFGYLEKGAWLILASSPWHQRCLVCSVFFRVVWSRYVVCLISFQTLRRIVTSLAVSQSRRQRSAEFSVLMQVPMVVPKVVECNTVSTRCRHVNKVLSLKVSRTRRLRRRIPRRLTQRQWKSLFHATSHADQYS